jgi:Zc3h12a-like Ribonuclease NYN domain
MIVPFVLLLCSLAGLYVATLPGFADASLLAVPCIVASLYLLLRGYQARPKIRERRGVSANDREKPVVARWADVWSRARKQPGRVIVIDGSNVMHWNGGEPQLETVRAVVDHLATLGFSPGVVFDANAGHILTGKYRHHAAMGSLLGLPEDRVMVVDKGTPADPIILAAAEDAGAQIVTNDRYRDWADAHTWLREPGRLVRGGYVEGKLWLDGSLVADLAATP